MLTFFENTWLFWWLIAILVLLRWFHVYAMTSESDEPESASGDQYSSHGAKPQAV